MDFIDEVIVEVTAGKGGNGMVSTRREKYVEFGGPSGGNGGNGGSVIFLGEEGKNTLLDLKYSRHIKAKPGENGASRNMHGKNADHKYVKVPLGTIVYDLKGNLIGEIIKHNQELIVAKGGKGGKGNYAFASPKDPCPSYAENGDLGQSLKVKIELKVLADVGLIGYPSVGKSTLISVLSNARPKIADYPFTTLSPNLGMVYYHDESYVIADLPGLIENASQGTGLGFKFLRHIQRCKLLVHVLSLESEDPYLDYQNINKELMTYDENLKDRPQVVVLNKMDLEDANEKIKTLKAKIKDKKIVCISAALYENLDELKKVIFDELQKAPELQKEERPVIYTLEEEIPFEITMDESIFNVTGPKIELLYHRTNFNNEDAVRRFLRQITSLGVVEALKEKGAKNNDTIKIFEFEFDFIK